MRPYYVLFLSFLAVITSQSGMSAEETIILGDGISVRVLYFEPESFVESPPLAILMSGGYSDEFMARAQFWLVRRWSSGAGLWQYLFPIRAGSFSLRTAASFQP